ncbi:MAG: hypothetical protein LBE36_04570 [Flavobacteriaceae bacterium]|jgi:hypothetical protein|nr:hypothetical protein [Flavobacteriaceae bacterium]
MNAIRQFVEVRDHSFNVSLPKDFNAKNVEIIIIPNDDEVTFELSKEQKNILDLQDGLDISEYQDGDEFLAQIKKEYEL